MMINRRNDERQSCKLDIKYLLHTEMSYLKAVGYNIGEGGMYFETEWEIPINLRLYVINGNSAGYPVPECYCAYMAEVRWCRKISDSLLYGVGVRFLVKSHILNTDIPMITSCDLCGNKNTTIHKTDTQTHLCSDCFRFLGAMVNEKNCKKDFQYIFGSAT